MDHLFHIPTLMLCLSAACVIISIFLTLLWLWDRSSQALLRWTLGFWLGCLGLILLGLRDVGPPILSIGLGNALSLWSLGLIWLGCRAFNEWDPDAPSALAMAGGLLWFTLVACWPRFAEDLNIRIIAASALYAGYSFLIVNTVWRGYRQEPLPARRLAVFAFGLHGLFYLLRLPVPLLFPATLNGGHPNLWFGVVTFEYFIQVLFGALAIFAMVHERLTLRYKVASEIDYLTGICNRRAFLAAIDASRARPEGDRAGAVLALLDADHFKSINDTHGHGAGDIVLTCLTGLVASRLPQGAVFGRVGGEEFAIYLPASAALINADLLEHIRVDIGAMVVQHGTACIQMSVSIGHCVLPAGRLDMQMALAVADRALYASKKAGRNCVTTSIFAPSDKDRIGGSPVHAPAATIA
ncbi:diguanylate cyclase [Rhizobium sp. PDO1-076]|nr:diguanylate cyclase [Rhizobium sp. PDO1-076]